MNGTKRSRLRRRISRSPALLSPVALLLGLTGFSLAALGVAGDLDPTFGGAGYAIAAIGDGADSGEAVVIQGDGKIIVAGASFSGADTDFAAVRYGPEGAVDSTFSGDGVVTA
ncbi:MAG: delta-60 repeat domain-containing protein, partial [Anaerolineae bacterium]